MDFNEYQSWVKQFIIEGHLVGSGSTIPTKETVRLNSQALIRLIREHAEKKEYRNLAALAEFLRGQGFFYFDYIDEFGTILEMILVQAIAVFDTGEVFNDADILWLPRGVYDLIFHQIDFEEYPSVCFQLYFELSKRVLNDSFMPLYELEDPPNDSYSQCLYFIDMADHKFLKRRDEFLVLWGMIERQMKEGKGYPWREESWPAAYAGLVRN